MNLKALRERKQARAILQRQAVEFSQPALSNLLNRTCALTLRPRGKTRGHGDLYIAWFARGVLKVGVSESPLARLASLPSDACTRGIISTTDEHPELRAVVPMGGIELERALLQALKLERIRGEYFSGPLSSRIAAVLERAP